MAESLVAVVLAFVLALVVTGVTRRYALARRLLDIPNARSSHLSATPRGGGLAIVLGFSIPWLGVALLGQPQSHLMAGILPAAVVVAGVGFWDDHRPLPARVRILVHAVAIAWALYWLGEWLQIPLPLGPVGLGWGGQLVVLLALVWFLNLFNFMDGIDGIAAGEAVFVAASGAVLALTHGQGEIAFALALLAAAAFGFLFWNWHPAKIFMGDVGSGFLGVTLGLLGYAAVSDQAPLLWPWLILVGVFATDATLTLVRRFLRGEPWYQAHRRHAYQHAARRWGHARVSTAVLTIDLAWLLPLALAAAALPQMGGLIALLAYAPLVGLALWLGAGAAEVAG